MSVYICNFFGSLLVRILIPHLCRGGTGSGPVPLAWLDAARVDGGGMNRDRKWPDTLWIVRHGESAGNVARDAAQKAGLPVIDIALRDVDVPLSPLGERQAAAFGGWFHAISPDERPTAILTSPYLRTRRTAEIVREGAGIDPHGTPFVVDERLREKEFGILDRLTTVGIAERYPEQDESRRLLGKFYHRPPGDESWCDVIPRLRSVVDAVVQLYRPAARGGAESDERA